jgi:hypothetical protein
MRSWVFYTPQHDNKKKVGWDGGSSRTHGRLQKIIFAQKISEIRCEDNTVGLTG